MRVVRRLPHPGRGFTQGLLAEGDLVIESTGGYGESALARYVSGEANVARETMMRAELPSGLFGEGICRVGGCVWQLTWKERVALRWDAATLELRDQVRYNREGWSICAVSGPAGPTGPAGAVGEVTEVVTSDGTSELVRRDPETLEPRAVVRVRCRGARVRGLNDLAWDGARIWANVAGTEYLAGIDLGTGEVTDVADARAAGERHPDPQEIMNGIAALTGPVSFCSPGSDGARSVTCGWQATSTAAT